MHDETYNQALQPTVTLAFLPYCNKVCGKAKEEAGKHATQLNLDVSSKSKVQKNNEQETIPKVVNGFRLCCHAGYQLSGIYRKVPGPVQ